MALVTSETKLCDVILDEPSVITVINRFGIALGVGDKSVKEICRQKGIDTNFFLTILNAYIYESFFPENGFDSFGAQEIIGYLEKTNQSYLRYQLPNIERHFKALIDHSEFNFSRNVLGEEYVYPFAYYTYNNGFAFCDSTGVTQVDNNSGKTLVDSPAPNSRRMDLGKAILQSSYDDLGNR